MRVFAVLLSCLFATSMATAQTSKKPAVKPLQNCAGITGCKQVGAWSYVADTDEVTDEKKLTAINVAENGSDEMLIYQCKGGMEVLVLTLGLGAFTLDDTKTFVFRFDGDPAFEQTWRRLQKPNQFVLGGEALTDFMQKMASKKRLIVSIGGGEGVKRFSLARTSDIFAIRDQRCGG